MNRRGVTPNFGAEVDVGEGTIGGELNVMIGEGSEGGDEEGRVIVEFGVSGDGA